MELGFEPLELLRPLEHDLPHPAAVELAAGSDLLTPPLDQGVAQLRAPQQLVDDVVGGHGGRAGTRERGQRLSLSGSDPPVRPTKVGATG